MSSGSVFKWSKEYLIQLLSSGPNPILIDPILINAMKQIDRKNFVPKDYENKAYDDLEIPIGYSETLSKPTIVAEMLAYLKPRLGGKYLDIGTGTGYSAAIMAFVAGDSGKVYSIERVQWIWEMARENIKKYPQLRNLELLYRDGIEGLSSKAPFDGIHIAFGLEEVPENLKLQLNQNGGKLVCPMSNHYFKIIERHSDEEFSEEVVPGYMMSPVKQGTA